MRIAIVDCGTNTFNLLVADASREGWKTVFQNKLPVKLGAGGFESGEIIPSRFVRGIDALYSHSHAIANFGVQRTYAFATSAIREARNGPDFVQKAREVAQIEIEVIDGDREADLICKGIRQTIDLGDEASLIMDIGGGSTEFIIANATEVIWKKSFLLGVSRVHEIIQPQDRLTHDDTRTLRTLLDRELAPLRAALEKFPCRWLVGSSGSFDTLLDLFREAAVDVDKSVPPGPSNDIPLSAFPSIHAWLMGSTYEERLKHPVIPAIRAEYMPVASFLVKYVLEMQAFRKLIHSAYALKEGAIQTLIESVEWTEPDPETEKPEDFLEE